MLVSVGMMVAADVRAVVSHNFKKAMTERFIVARVHVATEAVDHMWVQWYFVTEQGQPRTHDQLDFETNEQEKFKIKKGSPFFQMSERGSEREGKSVYQKQANMDPDTGQGGGRKRRACDTKKRREPGIGRSVGLCNRKFLHCLLCADF